MGVIAKHPTMYLEGDKVNLQKSVLEQLLMSVMVVLNQGTEAATRARLYGGRCIGKVRI